MRSEGPKVTSGARNSAGWSDVGDRRSAEQFMKEHGGAMASYEAVMKAVFEDMYEILRPICEECPSRM